MIGIVPIVLVKEEYIIIIYKVGEGCIDSVAVEAILTDVVCKI